MRWTIFSRFCFKLQSLFLSLEAPLQPQFFYKTNPKKPNQKMTKKQKEKSYLEKKNTISWN